MRCPLPVAHQGTQHGLAAGNNLGIIGDACAGVKARAGGSEHVEESWVRPSRICFGMAFFQNMWLSGNSV
jgi:hypothetical protein